MTSPNASATLFVPASSGSNGSSRIRAVARAIGTGEELVAGAALAAMVLLLLIEIVVRPWSGYGIPGSQVFVRQLTMWVALLGAALAARDGRLLGLATGSLLHERGQRFCDITSATVSAAVAAVLCVGAVTLVLDERIMGTRLAAGVQAWMSQVVLPAGFALIALRLVRRASPGWTGRSVAAAGLLLGLTIGLRPSLLEGSPGWMWVLLLAFAGAAGAPIMIVLGGAAVFLFMSAGIPPPTVLASAYELTTHPTLPALPLFTLGGFLLAEGGTPGRLLRLFRALFGWIPGGTAIACVILSAFFTIFTGGSGVTILALGGLLLPALLKDGYGDRFSLGLLTGSAALGLLLPPALPLILYAIVAEISVSEMMVGGILPGLVLIGLGAAHAVRGGAAAGVRRSRFNLREAGGALWQGKWEVLLPVVVLGTFFGGYATIVETAAITAIYVLVIQLAVHRDVSAKDIRRVFAESVAVIGGVLIILAVAKGLSAYFVDAGLPALLIEWSRLYVRDKYVFLLALNLFLLAVGCAMDIFSATFVVVPLIAPIAAAFGIHPVHLGVIFIANLELGYLTPPVGLNLFLSSYRFKRPLLEVCRASLPLLLILAIGVLLITYLPWLTTALLPLVAQHP